MTVDDLVTVTVPRWFAERMRLNAVRELRQYRLNVKHAKGLGRRKLQATFAARAANWEDVFNQIDTALAESREAPITNQTAPEPALEATS